MNIDDRGNVVLLHFLIPQGWVGMIDWKAVTFVIDSFSFDLGQGERACKTGEGKKIPLNSIQFFIHL